MQFARPEPHRIPFGFPQCVSDTPFTLVYNAQQAAEWNAANPKKEAPKQSTLSMDDKKNDHSK